MLLWHKSTYIVHDIRENKNCEHLIEHPNWKEAECETAKDRPWNRPKNHLIRYVPVYVLFENYDFIICTAEKLDSLIRHQALWIRQISTLIVDEIHLLNDASRGPTLEILITLLKGMLPNLQVIGLSATIGNAKDLANWLNAKLIEDSWRPVILKKGVYLDGEIEFKS